MKKRVLLITLALSAATLVACGEAKSEVNPEVETVTETEVKAETETKTETEVKAETEVTAETEAKAESETESKNESETEEQATAEESASIAGTYTHTYTEEMEGSALEFTDTIVLNDDGTCEITMQDTVKGNWSEGKITLADGNEYEFSVEGNALNLNWDGIVLEFIK